MSYKGSFIESSKIIRVENNILYAELRKIDGTYNSTSIEFNPNIEYHNADGNFRINNSIDIVVSRYNRNTDWLSKLKKYNTNIIVYDKENPSNIYNVPINRGNEASVYLKYIIDHYNILPDYTFFIHDEEYSWHHHGSIEERFLEAINSKQDFYNINHFNLMPYSHISEKKELMEWYNKYIEPYIPLNKLPNRDWLTGYKGCAQFLVHKKLIQHLPLKFYIDIYNWILQFENRSLSGYFLEWTWHLFWVISPKL